MTNMVCSHKGLIQTYRLYMTCLSMLCHHGTLGYEPTTNSMFSKNLHFRYFYSAESTVNMVTEENLDVSELVKEVQSKTHIAVWVNLKPPTSCVCSCAHIKAAVYRFSRYGVPHTHKLFGNAA